MFGRVLLLTVLCVCLAARPAAGQAPGSAGAAPVEGSLPDPHTYRAAAVRIEDGQAPRIDGRLDDAVWQLAPAQGEFIQREPHFGQPASERTEFRILYDSRTLYFGVWAFDSDPDGVIASELKRDAGLRKGDQIKIVLDTFHDHRNAFYFSTNPLGALKDAHSVEEGRTINYDWNAVWENRTTVDGQGWYVELAVPLNQLRFPGGVEEMLWGVNVCRIIIRKNEEDYWVPYPREWQALGFARVSRAGLLTGLRDLTPRRRLEFVPFASPHVTRNFDAGTPTRWSREVGFDLKVGLSQSFTADVTVNTDFAHVEADQEVVNLSRFSLFFPEKRQFFTEGAGTFDYSQNAGSQSGPGLLTLFYSRRIGLQEGQEVPILAGARVTGRTGPTTLGAMAVLTDAATVTAAGGTNEIPRAGYGVVRVKRDVLRSSSIGGIVLGRTGGARDNAAVGVDGVFTLGQHLDWLVFAARTATAGQGGDDWAAVTRAKWTSDQFESTLTYSDIGPQFNAELGFIPRTDVRNIQAQAAWTPRPDWPGVRQLRLNADTSYFENHAGLKESQSTGFDVSLTRQDSSSFRVSLDRQQDVLRTHWRTAGTIIPAGSYDWQSVRAAYTSNQSKAVYGSASIERGGYYAGDRQSYRVELSFVPTDTLLFENVYTRNRVELPWAAPYVTNVLSTRVSYSFSPDLFVKSFVQLNDATRTASVNLLLWYIYRPGSDFYIVYNEGLDTEAPGGGVRTRGRSLAVKMTYWWAR